MLILDAFCGLIFLLLLGTGMLGRWRWLSVAAFLLLAVYIAVSYSPAGVTS